MNKRAYFIAIEGIEGVGKTTLAKRIAQYFDECGKQSLCTREPGGTPIAEQIRTLLKDPTQQIDPKTELLMMFASRSHHIESVIKPALESGVTVISDRFVDASFAYQGAGRGIDDSIIEQLASIVCQDTLPDYTILVTCDPKVAMQRVMSRQEGIDRIEQEHLDFFHAAQEKYLALAKVRSNYVVINGEKPLDDVIQTLDNKLKDFIPL